MQRQRPLRGLEDESDVPDWNPRAPANLAQGRGPPERAGQIEVRARDAVESVHEVNRHPDGSALICDGAIDRLADPPRRVGRELEAAAVLEALDRLHQAEIALLDEVEERHLPCEVALGHGDDESEIRLRKFASGFGDGAQVVLDLVEASREIVS